MVDKLKDKRVPWSHLEEYLAVHQHTIVAFQNLLNSGILDKPLIEAKLPQSFFQLNSVIKKILRDNQIL